MTFEEFFTKKRIDLVLLQHAKPDLYEEFRDHYAQMSERSFDHTKKYWFNRLRKDFLLEVVEPPKASVPVAAAAKETDVSQANAPATKPAGSSTAPAGLSSMSPSGFKPRFKPNMVKPAGGELKEEDGDKPPTPVTKPTGVSSTSPSGFKPRFKPGVTATAKKVESNENPKPDTPIPSSEPPVAAASKPQGFKPRFKAGKTTNKKDDTDTT